MAPPAVPCTNADQVRAADMEGALRLVATFEGEEALFDVICERGLEGVVARRLCDPCDFLSKRGHGYVTDPILGLNVDRVSLR
jgi:hypothetical protein